MTHIADSARSVEAAYECQDLELGIKMCDTKKMSRTLLYEAAGVVARGVTFR